MTESEKQVIIDAVLSAIRTNSRTIEQLMPVSSLSSSDYFEVNGGRRIAYTILAELIAKLSETELSNLETAILDKIGKENGIAPLDGDGKVPVVHLPGFFNENSTPVCSFGTIPITPSRQDEPLECDALNGVEDEVKAGKMVTGTFAIWRGANVSPLNMHITSCVCRAEGFWHGLQFECVATDATNSNIRLHFMRVVVKFGDDGTVTYDSSALRQIDLPISSNVVIDLSAYPTKAISEDDIYEVFPNVIKGVAIKGKGDVQCEINGSKVSIPVDDNGCFMLEFGRLESFTTAGLSPGFGNVVELDFSNVDTDAMTSMSGMFIAMSKVESLDLSGFDNSKVTDMANMFWGCHALKRLDVSNFEMAHVEEFGDMFRSCENLTYIRCSGSFRQWCYDNRQTNGFDNNFDDAGNPIDVLAQIQWNAI